MHITPDIVAQTYELLRITPPFRGWKLPPADDVEFACDYLHRRGAAGEVFWGGPKERNHKDRHRRRISVCIKAHKTLSSVLETVAHEMVHLRQAQLLSTDKLQHGRTWKPLAAAVCRAHGWNAVTF